MIEHDLKGLRANPHILEIGGGTTDPTANLGGGINGNTFTYSAFGNAGRASDSGRMSALEFSVSSGSTNVNIYSAIRTCGHVDLSSNDLVAFTVRNVTLIVTIIAKPAANG